MCCENITLKFSVSVLTRLYNLTRLISSQRNYFHAFSRQVVFCNPHPPPSPDTHIPVWIKQKHASLNRLGKKRNVDNKRLESLHTFSFSASASRTHLLWDVLSYSPQQCFTPLTKWRKNKLRTCKGSLSLTLKYHTSSSGKYAVHLGRMHTNYSLKTSASNNN